MCSTIFARPLSVLLMPIPDSKRQDVNRFSKDNVYPKGPRFDKLRFDNESDDDWESLKIGYHGWLCNQLQDFAKDEDIEILIRFISWDQAHNEIDSLGKEFDIIQVPSTWTAHLINEGILAKWGGDVNLRDYPDASLSTCRIKGKKDIYAVPWHLDLRLLFFRSELTDDPNELSTFKGFRDCLVKRKEPTDATSHPTWEAPFCISKDKDWDILHDTLGYFWNRKIIEEFLWFWWRPVFDTEDGRKGIVELHKMANEGLVHFESFSENGRPAWPKQAEGLLEGRYDAVFGGLHMRVVFDRSPETQILAAPLPQLVPGVNKTFLGGSHLAVTTKPSKPYARRAERLIARLTDKESGISMSKQTEAVPANRQALRQYFESDLRQWDLHLDELLESGEAYPSIPKWYKLEINIVRDSFHDIILRDCGGAPVGLPGCCCRACGCSHCCLCLLQMAEVGGTHHLASGGSCETRDDQQIRHTA
jgi:ABC-type glycerol-3-phosphate transport system substrate-binding protein